MKKIPQIVFIVLILLSATACMRKSQPIIEQPDENSTLIDQEANKNAIDAPQKNTENKNPGGTYFEDKR